MKDWAAMWELGIAPLKQFALEEMKRDVLELVPNATEDSDVFRTGMILLASEMIGPYVDRLASFTGYPKAFIQGIAVRLRQAKMQISARLAAYCEGWG
jgi:hypothetical protein